MQSFFCFFFPLNPTPEQIEMTSAIYSIQLNMKYDCNVILKRKYEALF